MTTNLAVRAKRLDSSSLVQCEAEKLMISAYGQQVGVFLTPNKQFRFEKIALTVDGWKDDGNSVLLVEAWAHVGKAKSAQRNKVLADVLKLVFLTRRIKLGAPSKKVDCAMLFLDPQAATVIQGKTWGGAAVSDFGIRTVVINLAAEMLSRIKIAQIKQDIRIGGFP